VCVGSPFTVKVNGPPDPSKVRVSGSGIHNGVLQEYDGSFTVNTQGAGPGELTVKIRGPKGTSQGIKIVWDASRPSPSLPPFLFLPPLPSLSLFRFIPFRSRHPPIGSLKRSSSPSGSGRSPAAKRILTHFRTKFALF